MTDAKFVRQSRELKQAEHLKTQHERTVWENHHLGGFKRAFKPGKYDKILGVAKRVWTGKSWKQKKDLLSDASIHILDKNLNTLANCKVNSVMELSLQLPMKIRRVE